MAKFIALNTFTEIQGNLDLFSDEGLSKFRELLAGEAGKKIAISHGISDTDLAQFIASLQSSQTILFQNWIAQNGHIKACLAGTKLESFKDKSGILTHQYASAFKRFLSPFIAAELLMRSADSDKALATLFSYVVLLDDDQRAVVENQLFKPIRTRLKDLNTASENFKQEQELVDLIQPLCSKELVQIVNSLSKASYAIKLEYVDTIVNTIRTNGCTVRFANWIFKQMEELQLNNEHEEKIIELKRELKEGKLVVRNHGSGKTPIRWKSIITFLFIVLLGIGSFYIIYFKPFSNIEDEVIADTSSFKKFTKEERQKIDSLIQTMNNPLLPDDTEIDPGIPFGQGANLTLRKQSKNSLMENIYDDLSKDAEIQLYKFVDSCSLKRKKFKRYNGVKDLSKHKGTVEAIIKNESEYDVVLYVSENNSGGSVYSVFIKQGSTKEFKINQGDIITAVAGNVYIPYAIPTNINSADLPSDDFKYHFCDTDANYEESINSSYEYISTGRKKTKFMLMGTRGSYFSLMDIYGVLKPY